MTESKICEEMIKYFGTDRRRINHFMKVYTIAVTIAQQEGLPLSELEILKTAALMHDIGIKISEQKYGSSSGKYQELEGPAEAEKLLDRLGAEESLKDRVCWLIGHHHTYNMIGHIYASSKSLQNTEKQLEYVQQSLRIISGFYGVLKPFDGVTPYRLEMQAKLKTDNFSNLYKFWKDDIYKEITSNDRTIINLASKEYSKCITDYIREDVDFITCSFVEFSKGKLAEKGTFCKMARGEMVRFMAENNIENPEEIKAFDRLGYKFSENHSDKSTYVFIKE